jgi:hypothetical protein
MLKLSEFSYTERGRKPTVSSLRKAQAHSRPGSTADAPDMDAALQRKSACLLSKG